MGFDKTPCHSWENRTCHSFSTEPQQVQNEPCFSTASLDPGLNMPGQSDHTSHLPVNASAFAQNHTPQAKILQSCREASVSHKLGM